MMSLSSSSSCFFFPARQFDAQPPSWTCERALDPCYIRIAPPAKAILPARRETSPSPSPSLSPSSHALIFCSLIYIAYSILFCVPVADCPLHVEPVRLSRYFFPPPPGRKLCCGSQPLLLSTKSPRREKKNLKSQDTDPNFTLQATTPTARRSPSSPSRPSTRPPLTPLSAMSSLRPPRPL